jgi:hypothetical protein
MGMEDQNQSFSLGPSDHDPRFNVLQEVLSFFKGYVILTVMSVGVVGNTLSLYVFLRTKRKNDATSFYLSCLAVSDTICILYVELTAWLAEGLKYISGGRVSISFYYLSSIGCKLIIYGSTAVESTSAWIIVIMSIEKTIVVWFPLKRRSIANWKRKSVMLFVVVCCLLLPVYGLVMSDIFYVNGHQLCYYTSHRILLVVFDNSLFYFMPCFVIMFTNISIIIGIVKSRSFIKEKVTSNTGDMQEKKTLINLIVVSTTYLIFMTPNSVTVVYYFQLISSPSEETSQSYIDLMQFLGNFFHQFSFFNYCVNFIINGFSLPFYRQEVARMMRSFCCRDSN